MFWNELFRIFLSIWFNKAKSKRGKIVFRIFHLGWKKKRKKYFKVRVREGNILRNLPKKSISYQCEFFLVWMASAHNWSRDWRVQKKREENMTKFWNELKSGHQSLFFWIGNSLYFLLKKVNFSLTFEITFLWNECEVYFEFKMKNIMNSNQSERGKL